MQLVSSLLDPDPAHDDPIRRSHILKNLLEDDSLHHSAAFETVSKLRRARQDTKTVCCDTLFRISRARTLISSSIVLIAFKTSLWINDCTRMAIVWPQSTCFGACCFHIPTVIRYADLYTAWATSSQQLKRLAQKMQQLGILIRQVDDQLDVLVASSVKVDDGLITA